jgi:hypothetical protein
MIAWVALSMSAPQFTVDGLRVRLDRAFRGEFLPPREQGSFVVEGPIGGAQFIIKSAIAGAAGMFMLNSVSGPYTDVSGFGAHISDPDLRRLALAQEAWLSVDLIGGGAPSNAYRFIGKAIAQLAPADTAVLVDPESNKIWRFDDALRRRLAQGPEVI